MKDQVLVKYKNGDIRYVGKAFYLDRYWMFTLVEDEVVPKDKEEEDLEREEVIAELKAKGISFHPNSKTETLKKKLGE